MKSYLVPILELEKTLFPLLVILSSLELVTSRIVGRISYLHTGNEAINLTYQIGNFLNYLSTPLAILGLIITSIFFLRKKNILEKALGFLSFIFLFSVLTLYTYSYWISLLIVITLIPILFKVKERLKFLSYLLILMAFVTSAIHLYSGNFPFLRSLSESITVISSVLLFFAFNKKKLNYKKVIISMAVPLMLLIFPHYFLSNMAWVIRLISSFSLGFQLVLPIEAYSIALFFYLLTLFNLPSKILSYSFLLILLGGLPQRNTYPLMLTLLGLINLVKNNLS
ncbi:hypothetical protein HRbin06_00772 [archaeon HR06]|nr:hypothetical protein HRbin06_00772 [archaeon HR06]